MDTQRVSVFDVWAEKVIVYVVMNICVQHQHVCRTVFKSGIVCACKVQSVNVSWLLFHICESKLEFSAEIWTLGRVKTGMANGHQPHVLSFSMFCVYARLLWTCVTQDHFHRGVLWLHDQGLLHTHIQWHTKQYIHMQHSYYINPIKFDKSKHTIFKLSKVQTNSIRSLLNY